MSICNTQRPALVVALCAGGLLAASLASPVAAAALGGPDVRSSLNQPLRVRLPITLREGEDLAPTCVRAIAPKRDDLPMVPGARASLQRDDRGMYVLYSSAAAMTEPALRGAVEVGCTDPVAREFVVLLDPPAVNLPQAPRAEPAAEAVVPAIAPARASVPTRPSSVQSTQSAAVRAKPVTQVQPRTAKAATPTARQPKAASSTPKITDRLTLTAPDAGVTGLLGAGSGLRLSDLLSRLPQIDAAAGDPVQARQIAVEQARLAAILRDEDPFAAAQAKEKELSDRLAAMNRDLTAVRSQVTELAQRNRELERFAWLKWVVWALAGAMALVAAFFALRALRDLLPGRRAQKSKGDPWWSATYAAATRNPVTTVENLYRDTIKPVPARGAAQPGLEAATTSFDAPPDSAHKIEVKELERSSTTFMREFEPAPATIPDTFSTTIPQPTEFDRTAQPTRFQATKLQPVSPPVSVVPPQPGPFPDTHPAPGAPFAPLDFDLNLPALDLDVSPPEPRKDSDEPKAAKPSSKPPAKP